MADTMQVYCSLLFLLTLVLKSHQTYEANNMWGVWRKNTTINALPRTYFSSYSYYREIPLPMQMDTPLTMELCSKHRYYGRLRSCKMAKRKTNYMRSLSRKYFCESKDRWYQRQYKRSTKSRRKRATNQCGGTKIKQVILQAYEAERPWVLRELLHDPENHLYQTLFVESCQNRAPINGFRCHMHQIKFKAAVWSLNPNSDKISVIDVVTDGYCALSQP